MGHAATKPDKVNILLCDINKRLIMMWAVKLTSMTDDVLKSNNGVYGLVNFNAHFIIPECDKYKP